MNSTSTFDTQKRTNFIYPTLDLSSVEDCLLVDFRAGLPGIANHLKNIEVYELMFLSIQFKPL